MHADLSFRLRLLAFAAASIATVLAGKVFLLSVVEGEEHRALVDAQNSGAVQRVYDRGTIYFTSKDGKKISAATIARGSLVALDPERIADPAGAYARLSKIVEIDESDFMQRASREGDRYEEIAHRLGPDEASAIAAEGIEGVILAEERWRSYPAERLGSHVLGFVGWDGDILSGRYGLERYYNDALSRHEASARRSSPFTDVFGTSDRETEDATEKDAGDIVTSIEPAVELTLSDVLREFGEKWDPDTVGGIVMDPVTGKILAMAAYPDFDPNTYATERDPKVFGNPLVENVYELGSIMKPVTVAIGLSEGVIGPSSTYVDEGFIELDGKTIRNFDGRARGRVSMQEVLNQSLNTGASYVALSLGKDRFSSGMRAFGIGEETGIDLPNEAAGLSGSLDSDKKVDHATASFGQGIAVSPIMMARALAALGNGGVLVNPHLIEQVDYEDGRIRKPDYSSSRRAISKEASDQITRMLVGVVDTALVGGGAKLERYSIAAKTGTAQVPKPGGGYYEDRYLHSFFGYFPAYEPRFLVFLYALHPKGAEYASQTMTEPFSDLVQFLLSYYDVKPDR